MASGVAVSCISGMIGKTAFGAFGGTSSKLKLMTTAANETADGTEISGGSYPAGGISTTVSSTYGAASYSSGVASVTNSGAVITQANMPTVGGSGVISASIWDTGGTPVRWWWGDLSTGVVTNLGDTLTFNTSSVVIELNV
jgi:hypothetical protein